MARPSKEERLSIIHENALTEFDIIQAPQRDVRRQCLEDRRFASIAGAQWEGDLAIQFENKPKFEVNKIQLAVTRIINEHRNNRITVDFVSKDGSESDKLADVCKGLYRSDEQDSNADEAYDNAFEEGVTGGFGAWRLRTCYEDDEDDDNDHQRIRIEPIFDADTSVYFDLNAKRQDKADAKHCFVLYSMARGDYVAEYGDDFASWPKNIQENQFDWLTPDVVYIAEYYKVETVKEVVRVFRNVDGSEEKYEAKEFEDDPELEDTLLAIGSQEVRTRTMKRRRVHKYIMSGGRVLEDCGYIAGKCIPIIPFYGKRFFIDNIERCMGEVRLAKDVQRLKNMQISKIAEISAHSSVEKPIMIPEQVAGHQWMWEEDNIKQFPYLLVNPITDANGQPSLTGPIAYTRSPQIPPASAGLLQLTEVDMQEILGNTQQADKMVSNISEKTVGMIQERLDAKSFIYMSNFAKAMKRCGEVWLSMARDVYVEDNRKMKSTDDSGSIKSIMLMKPMAGKENGEIHYENDLTQADFDVAVDVGPSSSSKRASTVRALTGMMGITQDPETMQVLSAMAMMNMEGEGISDVRDYFRKKLVQMGAMKPTEEEQAAMQQQAQQQDPNAVFLQAAAEEATAKAAKARAETIETVASASLKQAQVAETRANTIETLSKIDLDRQRAALDTAQALKDTTELVPPPAEQFQE